MKYILKEFSRRGFGHLSEFKIFYMTWITLLMSLLSVKLGTQKSKDTFRAKRLEGYLVYHGVTGSSMKGGCGFYVKENFTPVPRTDLEFKISETGVESENCWIELVNNSGPNVLVGVFYRHPPRNNSLFQEKLKATMKKVNREKKL